MAGEGGSGGVERVEGGLSNYVKADAGKDAATMGLSVAKAAAAFIPVAGPFVAAALELVSGGQALKQRRQAEMLQRLVDGHGIELAGLKARLDSDEDLADLVMRCLDAAGRATFRAKISTLASIVAGAVDAPLRERVIARMLTRVLDEVEEEHIEVLVKISNWQVPDPAEGVSKEERAKSECTRDNVVAAMPHLALVMRMILNSLESLQLITNLTENSFFSQRGGAHYALTDLGTALLAKLRNEHEPLQSAAPA